VVLALAMVLLMVFIFWPQLSQPNQIKVGALLITSPAGWVMSGDNLNATFTLASDETWGAYIVIKVIEPSPTLENLKQIAQYWNIIPILGKDNFLEWTTKFHGYDAYAAAWIQIQELLGVPIGRAELISFYYENRAYFLTYSATAKNLLTYSATAEAFDAHHEEFVYLIESAELI